MSEAFNAPGLPEPFGIFSGAAWEPEGKVLHISGYVSQDADGNLVGVGDMKAQTHQVLKNIETVLASVGGNMADIARVTVYITDISGLSDIHEVRAEYFQRPYPASTLVEVSRLVRPEYLIEIDAVAVIPFDRVKDPS
jgi:enamine deaminase RidA (YjgF/YER057c/UK114 family)